MISIVAGIINYMATYRHYNIVLKGHYAPSSTHSLVTNVPI